MTMKALSGTLQASGAPRSCGAGGRASGEANWSFVYVFFTNHTPFDAPNRSEPCRLR